MPVVQLANLVSIAKTVGANRIVPAVAIPYPLGDMNKSAEEQKSLRKQRVEVAMQALLTTIEEATIFEVKK